MTAVVYSQLNPLANTFIPTKNELSRDKAIQNEIENEAKTIWEGRGKLNSNDLNPEYIITKETIKLDCQYVLWKEMLYGNITSSVLNVVVENSSTVAQTDFLKPGDSQLPMLLGSLTDDDQKAKVDTTLTFSEEKDECNCPPMFGWSIPPDFIGNPFNFKYECSKKYPHSPNCTVKQESGVDTLNYLDAKINQWTLDECLSEMKDILADVCETISVDSDPITKWDEKFKIQDYLEVSDGDSDEEGDELNDYGTESASLIEIESQLIDDGVHPLLQSGPIVDEDKDYLDDKDSVGSVEEMLGRSLSSLPEYFNTAIFKIGAACNPPCSSWCDSLPSAAKDTFRKYVQQSRNTDLKDSLQRSAVVYRPVFKRSLSADDAPMYGQISLDLDDTSEIESGAMLLRRKDPLNYFKIQSSNILRNEKHGSCDQQLLASSAKSKSWGKFDSADSLWQPLPDSNGANTHNLKLNFKKGRETKRQRTMS